ncbi:N-glycosyltransferase [Lacticaseibacillus paracasei]|uniref:glycosyltransferase family 2 protein n=1 Tax=Lacticaseibacillus paracasei TaxID=1597 RepID=UPI000F0B2F3E|nr:glycosyltransferase family 2 protein [Lacticaseibacillus paracasei]RNE02182.1 N-glycosyltransferase [Lacticaseibacillus paracasei]
MENSIDAVVVTYNRLPLLKECLAALLSQRGKLSGIFVINNHSTDGTTEHLERINDSLVQVITLGENIGGAAGFEYGVNKATSEGQGNYVWIMDDDTIPNVEAASVFLEKAALLKNDFGFLCSNVRWTDGHATNIAHVSKDWPDKINQGLVGVVAATFVSIFVPKDNIKQLGLPVGAMQIWGDDTEYTTRLSSFKKSFFVSDSVAVHKTGYNLMEDNLKTIQADRIWRFKAMYRNLIYVKRHYGSKKDVIKMVLANVVTGLAAITARDHRLSRLGAALTGTWNGFFFNPAIKYPTDKAMEKEIEN